jgi:hypothetical protein
MKAISMWQPWASLWLTPAKVHETRGRALHHRGWLLVHATKHIEREADIDQALAVICRDRLGQDWEAAVPRGAIIGAVQVDDCHTSEFLVRQWSDGGGLRIAHWEDYQCGNYGPRRFGIRRAPSVKIFPEPIPYRGMQAVPFDVPDDVVRHAFDQTALADAA